MRDGGRTVKETDMENNFGTMFIIILEIGMIIKNKVMVIIRFISLGVECFEKGRYEGEFLNH